LIYLDSPATAQRPRSVIETVAEFYRRDNANVHRGLYDLSRRATERYEAARETVARFVNAADPAEIVWVRGTTEAVNLVAMTWGWANIRECDEILLTILEHHSNLVHWQLLAQRTGARHRLLDHGAPGTLRRATRD